MSEGHVYGAGPTQEQLRIIEAPAQARVLVTAGPGTGKTYVLAARVGELIERDGLNPGDEILILSFSRAAVHEIRKRLRSSGGDAGYARAYTFDSFATRLLGEFDPDGPWTVRSYDERVTAATRLVHTNEQARELIGGYRQVLMDEIQDLVGVRAEFVKSILEALPGRSGFTLLGDPAQGIYNFQLPEGSEERRVGSAALYKWLRGTFGKTLEERSLGENKRARSERARAAAAIGVRLAAPDPDYASIKRELELLVADLPTLGNLQSGAHSLRRPGAKTALLCRTNGQALIVSRELHKAGVEHRLQGPAADRMLPKWPAVLFRGLQQQQVSRNAFERLWEERLADAEVGLDEAWSMLKRIEGKRGALDLGELGRQITMRGVPQELVEETSVELTVSTIHRAKGLEFDRVIVLGQERRHDDEEDAAETAEEVRLLYVALTRPRRELLYMEPPDMRGVKREKRTDRWVKWYVRGRVRLIQECEVRGMDVHAAEPAGGYLFEADAGDLQRYLEHEVRPGDAVELEKYRSEGGDEGPAHYVVRHAGKAVGVTSDEFGRTLYQTLKLYPGWKVYMPERIEELYVEAVDTVVGLPATGRRAGLGSSGLWLRIRVVGLGRLSIATQTSQG